MIASVSLAMTAVLVGGQAVVADTPEIERLIQQLGSPKFMEREAASKGLEVAGEPALDALEKAATSAQDAEVRRQSRLLIAAIKGQLARSGQSLHLGGHTDSLAMAVFSPDGRLLLTGGYDKMARLWEVKSGKEQRELKGHRGPVRSAAFSSDGRQLLTGGGNEDGVMDGKRVISDCTVRLWETATGKELRSFIGHKDLVTYVAFCPDGSHIISAGYSTDSTIRLWDLQTGIQVRIIKNPNLTAAALSPDGTLVLAGSDDKTVRLWEVSSGKELFLMRGHQAEVWDVAFSPDGTRALSCGGGDAIPGDYSIRHWDIKEGRELRRIYGHSDIVWGVKFSPDGSRALSQSKDKTVRLWDVKTGKELRYFVGCDEGVAGMAFSPDGRRALAVCTETNTLWQWNLPK